MSRYITKAYSGQKPALEDMVLEYLGHNDFAIIHNMDGSAYVINTTDSGESMLYSTKCIFIKNTEENPLTF